MSSILNGLLYINDVDVFDTYGAFLSEEKAGDTSNYSSLLKPPAVKPYVSVNFREQDGEKLPEQLTPTFEARDIELRFTILAKDKVKYLSYYMAFVNMLRSGWLVIRLPELSKSYKVYYQSCSDYTQLTPFDREVAGSFKVKFREPKPII